MYELKIALITVCVVMMLLYINSKLLKLGYGLKWLNGAKGEKGDCGLCGEKPSHEWSGTSIRFQNRDGSWGEYVDLNPIMRDITHIPSGVEGESKKHKDDDVGDNIN